MSQSTKLNQLVEMMRNAADMHVPEKMKIADDVLTVHGINAVEAVVAAYGMYEQITEALTVFGLMVPDARTYIEEVTENLEIAQDSINDNLFHQITKGNTNAVDSISKSLMHMVVMYRADVVEMMVERIKS